ncbi:calcium-binding protein, partial [Tistrella mobilis]
IGEYDLSGTVGADIFDLSGLGGYTRATVIRLGGGNDQFTGSAVTDLVDGGDGNDILKGGAGNDVLYGGLGNDQLDGGAGNDVFELAGRFDADTYLGGAGTDTIRLTNDAWSTRFTVKTTGSIERLDIGEYDLSGTVGADIFDLSGLGGYTKTTVIRLGAGNDQFTGSAVTDLVDGGDGNDILKGGAGNDVLHGGSGNDQLDGGDGNDVFELVGRFDADTYLGGAGTDTIRLTGDAWSTRFTVKTTGSIERLDIGEYDLSGTIGADIFDLSGLGGYTRATVIRLGGGNDQFTGSAVTDLVDGGDGDDILKGGAGKDQLFGNSGNDTISGGNEADLLEGGIGADRLSGGTGADRFIYTGTGDSTTAASGRDTILDFSRAGGDKIDLSAFAGTFLFIGTSGFTGKAMQLHAVSATSGLLIEGDINGDRFADFAILVAGVGSLVASDFIL